MDNVKIILCEAGMTEYNGIEFQGICSGVYDVTETNTEEVKRKINADLDNQEKALIEQKLKTQEVVTLVRRKISDEIIKIMGMEKNSYRVFSPTGEVHKTALGEEIKSFLTFGYESIIVY
jgi:hypothetical protein